MGSPTNTAETRDDIRRALRAMRRALSDEAREAAESRVVHTVQRLPAYRNADQIAIYLGTDGEVDVSPLLACARRQRKSVYAPVLAGEQLIFCSLDHGRVLTPNRYGILEPRLGRPIDPRSLDLVLTPLVAFDGRGARLGMGQAYYDRTFGFLRLRQAWLKPKLLGIAFRFQEIPALTVEPWDVRLWGVVTDAGARFFNRRSPT